MWGLPVVVGLMFAAVYSQLCIVYGRGTAEAEPCGRRHADELK